MVASNRGLAALPRWLVEEYAEKLPIVPVTLGENGIDNQIFLGSRVTDTKLDYVEDFFELARKHSSVR